MLFWTGIALKRVHPTQLWQHFLPVLEVSERARTEVHSGKVVFTVRARSCGCKTNGGGAQRWDAGKTQLQRKNLEHLDRGQVGKVAKKNQEALPELANVTERYVFFF